MRIGLRIGLGLGDLQPCASAGALGRVLLHTHGRVRVSVRVRVRVRVSVRVRV